MCSEEVGWKPLSYSFQSRTDTLPIGARAFRTLKMSEANKCRRCGRKPETLGHVVNFCHFNSKLQLERHDKLLSRVIDAIPKAEKKRNCIYKEKTMKYIGKGHGIVFQDKVAKLIPDLVLINPTTKEERIVDITTTTPWNSNVDALEVARKERIDRYKCIQQALEEERFKVLLNDAYVVGVNGAFKKTNDDVTSSLGISKTFARKMATFAVADVLRMSSDMYQKHVDKRIKWKDTVTIGTSATEQHSGAPQPARRRTGTTPAPHPASLQVPAPSTLPLPRFTSRPDRRLMLQHATTIGAVQ